MKLWCPKCKKVVNITYTHTDEPLCEECKYHFECSVYGCDSTEIDYTDETPSQTNAPVE